MNDSVLDVSPFTTLYRKIFREVERSTKTGGRSKPVATTGRTGSEVPYPQRDPNPVRPRESKWSTPLPELGRKGRLRVHPDSND